jgi:hypothetical protein
MPVRLFKAIHPRLKSVTMRVIISPLGGALLFRVVGPVRLESGDDICRGTGDESKDIVDG